MSKIPPFKIIACGRCSSADEFAEMMKGALAHAFLEGGEVEASFYLPDTQFDGDQMAVVMLGGVEKDKTAHFIWNARKKSAFCAFASEAWMIKRQYEPGQVPTDNFPSPQDAEDRIEQLMLCVYEGTERETMWVNEIIRFQGGRGVLNGWVNYAEGAEDVKLEGRMVEPPPGAESEN